MAGQSSACMAAAAALVLIWATAAAGKTVSVEITKLAFQPNVVTAAVGDVIEWTNNDAFVHTATAADKSWEVPLPVHGKGSHAVTQAGSIAYFCRFHPNMRGTIEVTAP